MCARACACAFDQPIPSDRLKGWSWLYLVIASYPIPVGIQTRVWISSQPAAHLTQNKQWPHHASLRVKRTGNPFVVGLAGVYPSTLEPVVDSPAPLWSIKVSSSLLANTRQPRAPEGKVPEIAAPKESMGFSNKLGLKYKNTDVMSLAIDQKTKWKLSYTTLRVYWPLRNFVGSYVQVVASLVSSFRLKAIKIGESCDRSFGLVGRARLCRLLLEGRFHGGLPRILWGAKVAEHLKMGGSSINTFTVYNRACHDI